MRGLGVTRAFRSLAPMGLAVLAACSRDGATGLGCRLVSVNLATLTACGLSNATGPSVVVSLNPAEYTLFSDSLGKGVASFPAAGSQGAQYLVVAQFATSSPSVSASFSLASAEMVASGPSGVMSASRAAQAQDPALRFHDFLRQWDSDLARRSRALPRASLNAAPGVAQTQGPPPVGTQRTFKVCGNLKCDTLVNVPATEMYLGAHAAIFLDDNAPSGGFTQSDLAALGQEFDTDLYPVDVNAFGAESDIDGNTVVIILLTKQINALIPKPQCQTSFVTGFFLGADVAPGISTSFNNGEVFYGFVPDPNGQVACAYSTSLVKALIPVTFIHEFQHMISFNQHVLVRNSDTEILWLNEAMSHLAEELGGLHFDSLGNTSHGSTFLTGDLYNAFIYLRSPQAHAMVTETPPGELEERGAEWLFLRYLVDRFGSTTTGQLEQTSNFGAGNITAVTGTGFATLLGRWALAVYATDLPGFTAPIDLTYSYWRFRSTYASLNRQDPANFNRPYPLVPATASGGGFNVTGTVTSGSGAYLLITQPSGGAAFDVTFKGPGGAALPADAGAQIAVLRIR